jgi:membrane-bound metal-dependent hydrolase YbcI (DUF457 family)
MPSPIGHALAGVAISLAVPDSAKPPARSRWFDWKLAGTCALFASLPDIDLLYMPIHRTVTHSIPVAILVTIIAVAVTGQVNRGQTPDRNRGLTPNRNRGQTPNRNRGLTPIGLACGLAWASHVLMDWLGADANPPYGIQMFWPFSDRWYFSGWNLFPGTERRDPFGTRAIWINLRAALTELGIMGSVAIAAWAARTAVRLKTNPTDGRSA